jgi:hypothetical protein
VAKRLGRVPPGSNSVRPANKHDTELSYDKCAGKSSTSRVVLD